MVSTEACDADEDGDFALRIWSETEVLLRSSDTAPSPSTGTFATTRGSRPSCGSRPAKTRRTIGTRASRWRFVAASLDDTERGNVAAGPPARIQVINDDPVPVVEFGSRALTIDEGGSQTVAIVTRASWRAR